VARWQVPEIIHQLYLDSAKGKSLHGDLFKDYPIKNENSGYLELNSKYKICSNSLTILFYTSLLST
jgi:hypothetical protein